jgi:hypothetical protein
MTPKLCSHVLVGALGCAALAGCALLAPSPPDPFTGARAGATTVRVDVENRNFYDATIYATMSGGSERRVGDVGGNGRRSFDMPLSAPADVRFRIELLADGWCTTYPIALNPGDGIGLQIVADFPGAANCESRGGGTPGE